MRQNGGWVRLYCDILENPKLRTLSESSQLFFFWCLCLHKRGWLVGKSDTEISYSLRLKVSTAAKRLNELKEANLLLSDNTPKGWQECQYSSDSSAERMKALRERRDKHRYSDGDVTANVQDVTESKGRHSDGTEQNRTEQNRAEQSARGENLGSGEPGTVVARCRKMYADLRELGPDWERLTFEHLVELVKGHPRADLDRVRARIWADWKGQALPAIKTPPMIVRQCLEWDEADGGRGNARKSAAPRGGVPSPEELRMRRMGGAGE
jgi:hypothetical protein